MLNIKGIRQGNSPVDCSQYVTDIQIVDSFPFIVYVDPVLKDSRRTYALKNYKGFISYMNIASEKSIPSSIYCLKHLSDLDIRNTSFRHFEQLLSSGMEHFASSLIHLGIYDTPISSLPEQFWKLKRLITLVLSNTGLIKLSDAMGDLSSLVSLSLPDNQLTLFPKTFRKLRLLQHANLENNPNLRSLSFVNGLPSLKTLNTRNCPVEELPRHLPMLTNLYMENNNLTRLVGIETLGDGTNITKTLNFHTNHIRTVTSQIRYVKNLGRLNLNNNEMVTLTSDMFKMMSLHHLDIRKNYIQPGELDTTVTRFRENNPKLKLHYKPQQYSVERSP